MGQAGKSEISLLEAGRDFYNLRPAEFQPQNSNEGKKMTIHFCEVCGKKLVREDDFWECPLKVNGHDEHTSFPLSEEELVEGLSLSDTG